VTFVVDSDGSVRSLAFHLVDDVISDYEKNCAVATLSQVTFPVPGHETTLVYPLVFDRHHSVHKAP
jgi:hypothetical protein